MAGKRFVGNMSSHRIKLITRLFYQIRLNPATAPLTKPFGRGYLHRIGLIHQSHAIGGANGSTMVVMFVDCCVGAVGYFPYYSYSRNRTGRELFVPVGTLIAVKLLILSIYAKQTQQSAQLFRPCVFGEFDI